MNTATLLPGVDQCDSCPNLMRPHGTLVTEFPGTAQRARAGVCNPCARDITSSGKRLEENLNASYPYLRSLRTSFERGRRFRGIPVGGNR